MTAADALAYGRARLVAEPLVEENAARDAELLLMHVLKLGRASLMAHPELVLDVRQQSQFEQCIAQRLTAMPVQYITGEQEFYGLRFSVTPDVLIPRPETEHLVEEVLKRTSRDDAVRIVDVGTGSGAIAVALATHLPRATICAVDISSTALRIAEQNAEENGVGDRIAFLQSDLFEAVESERFDVVVSNPPYIPLRDKATLHPQVREYEPELALFAGHSGLDVYEKLIPQAWNVLEPGGLLVLEFGHGQQAVISALLQRWLDVEFARDLQGIPRIVVASKP